MDDYKAQWFQNCNSGVTKESSEWKWNHSPTNWNRCGVNYKEDTQPRINRKEERSSRTREDSFLVLELSPSRSQLGGCSTEEAPQFSFNFPKQEPLVEKVSEPVHLEEKCATKKNYSKLVNKLVTPQSSKTVIRTDVINKRIIRFFRKYICELSTERRMVCRLKRPITDVKNDMINQATSLGLLSPEADEAQKEFMCWMCMNKKTSKVNQVFDLENASIKLASDLFLKYSHKKLNLALTNKNIASLFMFFIRHQKDEFLSLFSSDVREAYFTGINSLINKACLTLNIHQ